MTSSNEPSSLPTDSSQIASDSAEVGPPPSSEIPGELPSGPVGEVVSTLRWISSTPKLIVFLLGIGLTMLYFKGSDLLADVVEQSLNRRGKTIGESSVSLPIGTIIAYSGRLDDGEGSIAVRKSLARSGWLVCDGKTRVTAERHPLLYQSLLTTWGNTKSPIYTPDLSNQFLRGVSYEEDWHEERYYGKSGDHSKWTEALSHARVGTRQIANTGSHWHPLNHLFETGYEMKTGSQAVRLTYTTDREGLINEIKSRSNGYLGRTMDTFSEDVSAEEALEGPLSKERLDRESRPENVYVHFLIKADTI